MKKYDNENSKKFSIKWNTIEYNIKIWILLWYYKIPQDKNKNVMVG